MALTPGNAIIGPAFVTYRGTELGLTTEDGVTLTTEFNNVELHSAQSLVRTRVHRDTVNVKASATFQELTQANLRLLMDLNNSPTAGAMNGAWDADSTEGTLVITAPGSQGSTRVYTATAVIMTPPELVFANNAYTGAAVEFGLIGNATTNQYWTETETASSDTVPAVSSYAKLASSGDTETAIVDGATAVAVTSRLMVVMNVAIRPDMLNGTYFYLVAEDGNSAVPCSIAYGTPSGVTDYARVTLTPTSSLSSSTKYNLIVAKGVLSFDGLASAAMAAIQFTTS